MVEKRNSMSIDKEDTTASDEGLAVAIPTDTTLETRRLDLVGTTTSEGYEMKEAATQTNDNSLYIYHMYMYFYLALYL
jgi:hypothetical protein